MSMHHPQRHWRDWWRVLRVAQWLALRPQDVLPYARHGLGSRRTPLELGMPWWSFGAVAAVGQLLRSDMDVFEFGSGGSSIFLAGRAGSVICVEDEEKWAARVQDEAGKRGLRNLTVLHRPFDFHYPKDFAESSYLAALGEADFDVIVVDGKEESGPVRDACFWKAEEHIKPGGFIVLDDSWRYPQVKARNKALNWTDHKGTGYCRVGVTSTAVFAY
jgi:precorrin-6B methylase 2